MKEKRISNPDVPPEAVIRQLVKENQRLRQEKGELKMKLENKEYAIREFKKWQARLAEKQWGYWLNEGIRLMDVQPDPDLLSKVRQVISLHHALREWERKVNSVLCNYKKAAKILREELSNQ